MPFPVQEPDYLAGFCAPSGEVSSLAIGQIFRRGDFDVVRVTGHHGDRLSGKFGDGSVVGGGEPALTGQLVAADRINPREKVWGVWASTDLPAGSACSRITPFASTCFKVSVAGMAGMHPPVDLDAARQAFRRDKRTKGRTAS
jgi:hypothetical protein